MERLGACALKKLTNPCKQGADRVFISICPREFPNGLSLTLFCRFFAEKGRRILLMAYGQGSSPSPMIHGGRVRLSKEFAFPPPWKCRQNRD